jgi:hypothetical protein
VASATPRLILGPLTSAAYAAGAGPIAACAAAHAIDDTTNVSLEGDNAVHNTANVDTDIAPNTTFFLGAKSASSEAGHAPIKLVSAIALNKVPISPTFNPCVEAANNGNNVARPPDPEKNNAELTPDAAKKSRRAFCTRVCFCDFFFEVFAPLSRAEVSVSRGLVTLDSAVSRVDGVTCEDKGCVVCLFTLADVFIV